jgi:glutamate N-acetyltransferase/amino-acid N-acetyltransferase
VLNSGNANACTGPGGHQVVRATAERAATELGCRPEQVLICSTGVIGLPLDAERVGDGVAKAAANLGRQASSDGQLDDGDGQAAAEAIRTTDTVAKQARTRLAGGVTVGGMAKGAAMLAPAMAPPHATMLAVLTTDAQADPAAMRAGLAAAADDSFNRITVDGAQSTNDTVLLLAYLATQMLADAEGGTKVIAVEVGGAGTLAAALAVARRVADSPLVKAAVYGGDPNWGRVLQAAGTAGVQFDPDAVSLEVGGGQAGAGPVVLVRDGAPTGVDGNAAMAGPEVRFRLDLGGGGPCGRIRTVDLTPEYVRLNSEYTT